MPDDDTPSAGARTRPRGLVPVGASGTRQAPRSASTPYRVRVDPARRDAPARSGLPSRPWRAIKVAAALFLLGAVATFSAVQGVRAFSGVVDTDENRATIEGYAAGSSGVSHIDEEDGFSVDFPSIPVRGVTSEPGGDDAAAAAELRAESDDVTLTVVRFDLEGEPEDPASTFSFIAAVAADDLGGDLADRGMQPTAPVPTHEFAVTTSDQVDLVRHVLDGERIFQLRVSAPTAEEDVFVRFVDSFQLIGAPT